MKYKLLTRLAAALTAGVMLLSCAACSSKDSTLDEREQLIEELYGSVELAGADRDKENEATTSNFVLAYSKNDPLNPYACESTLNAAISDLLYDQLIIVNSEFEAELSVAVQIERTSSRLLTVTLRDGIVFSDGSELTGSDVRYSFNAAKDKDSRFAAQLANISGCSSQGSTVYFRLTEPDPRAYMLLDFPIIKAETDYGTSVPIGSGRYTYFNDPELGTYLVRNELWYSTNSSDVERISLVSMPTIESIIHSVEIGTVTYYYTDLRDGYPSRINANYSTVDVNNLIYIGMDTTDSRLTQYLVREAISLALNREEIITTAYAGRAYAATGPYTTSWPTAAGAQSGNTLEDTAASQLDLGDAGFINLSEDYIRSNGDGTQLSLELLVNRGSEQLCTAADIIASQLAEVGIRVTVNQVSFDTLRERVAAGQYDLYLGEYALFNNMDLSKLFTPNSGLYYGLSPDTTIASYNSYLNGSASIADVVDAFDSELPFIPVCYRLGMACYSRSLAANMDITESDLFYHMSQWDVALAQVEGQETEQSQDK